MKYLLCEAHGIGDCILILPIAKAIKMYDPNAYIKVFTCSNKKKILINKSIMSLQNYVDDIDYYSRNELFHSFKFLIGNIFTRYDYGIVIQDYDSEQTSAIPSYIVRACCKDSCGVKITRNKKIKYHKYVSLVKGKRRDELFYEAAISLGLNVCKQNDFVLDKDLVCKFLPNITFKEDLPIVILVLGTSSVMYKTKNGVKYSNVKKWPYQNWLLLSERLADSGYNVVLLGGKNERIELKSLNSEIEKSNRIYNLVGCLNIKESISVLCLSTIVVGADTGLMHCAGALGKSSLTLFGSTNPKEYLPFGKKSHYIYLNLECAPCFGTLNSVMCDQNKCMRLISVDMVYNKVINLMSNKN